jgi:hypothetical protein
VSRRTRVLIALAVAVVLAVAGAVWAYDSDRGPAPPGPSATGLSQAWTAHPSGVDTGPAGAWVTGRDVVVNVGNGLVAYRLGSGRTDWSWHPPAGRYFDNMSPTADLGVAVVAYGTGASASANPNVGGTATASPSPGLGSSASPSTESGVGSGAAAIETVAAINLTTGRLLWSTPLADPIGWPGPVVGDERVAVLEQTASGGFGALDVLNLSTGVLDWSTASDTEIPASCAFTSAAISGGLVYGAAQCPQPGASDTLSPTGPTGPSTEILYGFAPETGAIQTNTSTSGFLCTDPDQNTYATLWAEGGYLLVSCSENTTTSEPLWIAATGATSASGATSAPGTLKLVAARFVSQTDPLSYEFENLEYPAFAVVGRVLYLQVLIPAGSGGRAAVTALDLGTGRQLWREPIPGGSGYLVGADSTGATVALESGGTLSLAHVARTTGTITYGPGAPLAATAGSRETYRVLAAGTSLIAVLPGSQAAEVIEFHRVSAG